MTSNRRYPPLLVDWLTPAYDSFVKLCLRERRIKRELIARARLAPGDHVLDLGTGTGTLAIWIKRAYPNTKVTGLDADGEVLAIARTKAARVATDIAFDLGTAAALPYPDQSFDHIVSSLVFSLLGHEEKHLALREAHRVLRPRGEVHIADFGPPHTAWGRFLAPRMRRFEPISDNLDGRLPAMLSEAGFEDVAEHDRFATVLGTVALLHGRRPGRAHPPVRRQMTSSSSNDTHPSRPGHLMELGATDQTPRGRCDSRRRRPAPGPADRSP